MASYYLSGYNPPSSITNADQVKALQKQLGVTADGIWGPKTQAAYNSANGINTPTWGNSASAGFSSALTDALAMIPQTSISYTPQSEASIRSGIESYLRPSVDQAIANRQKQTITNKANIDADAASRGMGASTWVTDVKNRQQNAEASDVASMESNYGATLAERIAAAMAQERANSLSAQQFNATAQANAISQALSLANGLYGQSLKSSGSGKKAPTWQEQLAAFASALSASTPKTTYSDLNRSKRISGAQA
ncbi:MAG TPA: hypothetical protein VN512_13185 [Clostridia bacterium]|nr:hypothetical protein [Clostridia bacterium]